MSVNNGKQEPEPTAGPQEIEPLGPGYGYKVQLILDEHMTLEIGRTDNMQDAVGMLQRAKEGLGRA